jgi:glucose-6-phosphate 1-dehydrogenase
MKPHGIRSDAFVFFGATGDLAYKQIFPALQALIRRDGLDMPIIGVAKGTGGLEDLIVRARQSLQACGELDDAAFAKLRSRLRYVNGDYTDPGTFTQLRKALGDAKRPLHYLAIPPNMFATVAKGLADARCTDQARILLEKPFGRNLASARALNRTLAAHFAESDIFRIDHFLGKEPVQNLVYFRAANPRVEASFRGTYIDSVQITMAEKFGVEGRGKFYEEVGAIRDVVQNHMLEVIACLAMESPLGDDHEAWRDKRSELLKSVRTLDAADVVRGQFHGYREQAGVAPDSTVETFAAVRFHIDNDRWAGTPFYVRVGKSLPTTATEILVRFKCTPAPVLDEATLAPANTYRFRISPDIDIAFGTNVKKSGTAMVGQSVELVAHHQAGDDMHPYERLLGDASVGDRTLFARQDAVEESWRIVDPIVGDATPLFGYAPQTWGPAEVGGLLVPEGGGWHDPE